MLLLKRIKLRMAGNLYELPASRVVVLVGPNGSGKSRLLREIHRASLRRADASGHDEFSITEIQTEINKESFDKQINEWYENYREYEIKRNGSISPNTVRFARMDTRDYSYIHDNLDLSHPIPFNLESLLSLPSSHHGIMAAKIISIDGAERLAITKDARSGDVLQEPQNLLQLLLKDRNLRSIISNRIFDAIGKHFLVDPTAMVYLRIRLSDMLPSPAWIEDSVSPDARNFYSRAQHIAESSDGVKAFVGLLMAAIAARHGILLVDEPEAFLHPPLARRLGRDLVQLVEEGDGQIIVATHSSDFLLGCLEGSKQVTVIRLSTPFPTQPPVVVEPDTIQNFLLMPLFRSANVVSALFHQGAVVTEGDNDRAFYSEIYQRIRDKNPDIPFLVFLSAQNKQTLCRIFGPLRKVGVPAAAIADIDILKENFTDTLKQANFARITRESLSGMRARIKDAFDKKGLSDMKPGDLERLDSDVQAAARDLFDELEKHGIFVVRQGQLENWLPNLGLPQRKGEWTVEVLSRLGLAEGEDGYIPTSDDDVWAFIQKIAKWCGTPDRLGMSRPG